MGRPTIRVVATLALLAALAAPPAAAQDKPAVHPSRDVSVTYRAEGGPQGGMQMTLSWLNAEQKMRMDMPGGMGWTVTEMQSGRAFMVSDPQRTVMTLPADAAGPNPLQHGPNMRFTRGGTETILGHRCTVWQFQEGEARGEACVTEDGVMLRSRGTDGQHSGSMTATAVSLTAQDPARFRPPQGYRTMAMPMMPPGGPGGAPGPSR